MVRFLSALALCCVLTACQDAASTHADPPSLARGKDDGTVEHYQLRGVVVRRDEARRVVTIKHGPVKDAAGKVWMEPMTMDFPVLTPTDLPKLQPGNEITAQVHSRRSDFEYWITDVRPAAPAAP